MDARLSLLFVCEQSNGCLRFQDCLKREGFQLLMAADTERAAKMLLSTSTVDAVLIHQDNIAHGSSIGSGLKVISPLIPVLLVSAQSPTNGVLPAGVDALCYANFLGRRSARDIAKFVRCLLEDSANVMDRPQDNHGRFAPPKPTYLN